MNQQTLPSPRVSVVTAVYNCERFLSAAIESILGQTYRDFEYVIVDDGSTDETPAILSSAAQQDRRVRVATQPHLGIPASLNRGTELARGELLARQDADDISLPERLEIQVAYLDEHPEVAMVGGFAEMIDEHEQTVVEMLFPTESVQIREELLHRACFMHGSLLFRREALLAVGGYRTAFRLASDYDLWLRMSEHYQVTNLPLIVYCWRHHDANSTQVPTSRVAEFTHLALRLARQRRTRGWDDLMADDVGVCLVPE